jgi:hypothetical protein
MLGRLTHGDTRIYEVFAAAFEAEEEPFELAEPALEPPSLSDDLVAPADESDLAELSELPDSPEPVAALSVFDPFAAARESVL